jgi:hypothetical protein
VAANGGFCNGDGEYGYRVQVIYIRSADQPDNYSRYLSSFRHWIAETDQIVQDSAAKTGGARRVRFVHDSNCELEIPNITLSPAIRQGTDGDAFSAMVRELSALGYRRSDRRYVVFADVTGILCGLGQVYGDDSPGRDNLNNTGPLYSRIDAGCWSGVVAAHELMHNIGAVQSSAPNSDGGAHCTDGHDVMCYGPGWRSVCTPAELHGRLLDCNNDDYFNTAPVSSSYLNGHWNTANSYYLIGTGAPPPPPECEMRLAFGPWEPESDVWSGLGCPGETTVVELWTNRAGESTTPRKLLLRLPPQMTHMYAEQFGGRAWYFTCEEAAIKYYNELPTEPLSPDTFKRWLDLGWVWWMVGDPIPGWCR